MKWVSIRTNFVCVCIFLILFIPLCFSAEINLTYDNNGNLISGFGLNYSYNNFNQLINITDNSNNELIFQYLYDSEGTRIKKVEYFDDGSNETAYYISGNFIQIRNNSGVFNETYYYDEKDLIARKDNNGNRFYYHPDHLGSTTIVTNSSGDVVEETFYKPFGEVVDGSNSRYGYTGKEKDGDTGLMYYGARYYNPNFMHFIQPDSVIGYIYNPQDLNRYAYVRNNPYKYIDPSGNEPVLDQIGSYTSFYNELVEFESSQDPGLTASETLSNLVSFKGTFKSKLGNREDFLANSNARYVYTSDKGFVDNLHLITSAAKTKQSNAFIAILGGIYVELVQLGVFGKDNMDLSSAFSYEDIPTNGLGPEFSGKINDNNGPFSLQYLNYIESKGGSTTPLKTLESEYPGTSGNIIEKEKGRFDKPTSTSYSSWGKAIPPAGSLDKTENSNSGDGK
ncbi:hypothetical protein GOV12_04530 [Candidatus Pacearchaeota archaeon]|nr:hypothetical protein [Candidatus Pacearchaeota archaeon]